MTQDLTATGSSPRMRGALAASCFTLTAMRIIPAYAGSTLVKSGDAPAVFPVGAQGSSPRMRGALRFSNHWSLMYGIIPAYAGSTV